MVRFVFDDFSSSETLGGDRPSRPLLRPSCLTTLVVCRLPAPVPPPSPSSLCLVPSCVPGTRMVVEVVTGLVFKRRFHPET